MGLPGRPNLPTSIKEARGTARADRVRPDEPKPPTLEVGARAPSWLKGARRQRAWRELAQLLGGQRVLTVLDAAALALLVDAYGDFLEATDLIRGQACGRCGRPVADTRPCNAGFVNDEGVLVALAHEGGDRYYTTRTKEGSLMIRPHPALAIRQDAWKRVTGLLVQFGMTPAARARVGAAPDPADADPLEGFLGARRTA